MKNHEMQKKYSEKPFRFYFLFETLLWTESICEEATMWCSCSAAKVKNVEVRVDDGNKYQALI